MKFQLVAEQIENMEGCELFALYLYNLSTNDKRESRIKLAVGTSLNLMRQKSTTIMNVPVQWCYGDDHDYDSTEYFEL